MSTVTPEPGTRLEQLVAQYDQAKAAADHAAAVFKEISDGIKLELANAAAGEERVNLASDLLARPLRMMAVSSWRVDAKRLKAEAPETYVRYAVKNTSWQLRPIGANS